MGEKSAADFVTHNMRHFESSEIGARLSAELELSENMAMLRVRDIALSTLYAAPFCGAIAMPERSATGLTGVFAPLRSE